ncbi:MAG: hypothetical protein ACK55Z_34220, partial [bacterium]
MDPRSPGTDRGALKTEKREANLRAYQLCGLGWMRRLGRLQRKYRYGWGQSRCDRLGTVWVTAGWQVLFPLGSPFHCRNELTA